MVRTRLDHSQLTRTLEIVFCGATSSKFFQRAFFNRSCKGPRLACGNVCLVNGCPRRKVIDTVPFFRGGNTSLASEVGYMGHVYSAREKLVVNCDPAKGLVRNCFDGGSLPKMRFSKNGS